MNRQAFAACLLGLAIPWIPATVHAQALPPLESVSRYLPDESDSQGYITPAQGLLTSGYGWRWGRMHQGIDIAADVGTPVIAAASGTVEYAGFNSGGYGNLIEIRHADGSLTRYAHLNTIAVQREDHVEQGQRIGEMGSTGHSTGPHLHFEIHLPQQGVVDPAPLTHDRTTHSPSIHSEETTGHRVISA